MKATFTISAWRQRLARSLHLSRSKPEAKYIQLATLNNEGFVQNRTLVFRGFVDESDHIIMITDTRSDKFHALQVHSQAEICWYFAKTREQYRLSGNIKIFANSSDLRTSVWNKISPAAKSQFYWYLDEELVNELSLNNIIPDTFCVLLLETQQVDYLLLADQHERIKCQLIDKKWQETHINP